MFEEVKERGGLNWPANQKSKMWNELKLWQPWLDGSCHYHEQGFKCVHKGIWWYWPRRWLSLDFWYRVHLSNQGKRTVRERGERGDGENKKWEALWSYRCAKSADNLSQKVIPPNASTRRHLLRSLHLLVEDVWQIPDPRVKDQTYTRVYQ